MTQKKYIHTAQVARNIDYQSIHTIGIPSMVLMEHAAIESTKYIYSKIKKNDLVVILCGPGNNGGDGLAIARLLWQKGIQASIFIPSVEKMSDDEKHQYDILCQMHVSCMQDIKEVCEKIQYADIIVDCLFGNGLSRDVTGNYQVLIEKANESHAYIFSIDVPSGLNATSGKILNTCIHAHTTIALDCFKIGMFICDGPKVCGNIQHVDIGIPQFLHESDSCLYLDQQQAKELLPIRNNFTHKGTFKKALMIGGSQSMHGAITLAAQACYKSGIGTLTLMIPECIGDILAKKMEFAMNLRVKDKDGFMDYTSYLQYRENLKNYGLITIGNGMGQNQNTKDIVQDVLSMNIPTIVDADAIWALKDCTDILKRETPTILTPHIKEMSYLTHKSVKEILDNPYQIVNDFIESYPNCTIILKSSISLIAGKNGLYVLNAPNSALAKGGSGDILCGIVAGICGQSDNYLDACATAAYIHSQTAKRDIDSACYQPEDCIQEIPAVFKKLRGD